MSVAHSVAASPYAADLELGTVLSSTQSSSLAADVAPMTELQRRVQLKVTDFHLESKTSVTRVTVFEKDPDQRSKLDELDEQSPGTVRVYDYSFCCVSCHYKDNRNYLCDSCHSLLAHISNVKDSPFDVEDKRLSDLLQECKVRDIPRSRYTEASFPEFQVDDLQ